MLQTIRDAFRINSEEGATAVEYGIMVAAIAAVIVAIVFVVGNQVQEGFCDTAAEIGGQPDIEAGPAADGTDCD